MNILYKPTGSAKEYAGLACNLYNGCTHGCTYCYGPATIRKKRQVYYDNADAKKDILKNLQKDCKKLNGNISEILLSFIGDVYQPAEVDLMLTREAIKILIAHNLPFTILTKGGTRAVRDFDLLGEYNKARFGTTLVFIDQHYANTYEPDAASIIDRIKTIQEAYERNIDTWVSLEPVIEPVQALQIIRELHPIVSHWKVGKINYNKEIEWRVDWIKFREDVIDVLQVVNADFYIKKSLTEIDDTFNMIRDDYKYM